MRVRRRCGDTAKLNFSFEILYNTQPLSYMLTLTGSRGSSSLLTFWSFRVSASMSQSTDPEEENNENRRFANRFADPRALHVIDHYCLLCSGG